jgi:hypothetical protein
VEWKLSENNLENTIETNFTIASTQRKPYALSALKMANYRSSHLVDNRMVQKLAPIQVKNLN